MSISTSAHQTPLLRTGTSIRQIICFFGFSRALRFINMDKKDLFNVMYKSKRRVQIAFFQM